MPLNEADTRANLIDPALAQRGWTADHIRREMTRARIEIDTIVGKANRRGDGRIDYLLRYRVNPGTLPVPLALIEAKAESKAPGYGLEQAKGYRELHNVPFVFSSNGHLYVEYDEFTGLTTAPRPLAEFPTPDELRARYEKGKGFALDAPEAKPLITPYRGGEGTRRYYQDAAIRAVLEKIAQGGDRALLTLATGTGKTFIATNLLHRIAEAGHLRRALFLCDRDELRKQGLLAMTGQFGSDAAEAYRRPDGRNNAANARVHVATYQTLGVDSDADTATFLREFYPENYFSHIVIDECHRSAWGRWIEVLDRNPDAVHIGLTATPRTLDIAASGEGVEDDRRLIADNVGYFGEPVYEYDIAQGIEDGYLAACEIVRRDVFIEEQQQHEVVTGVSREDLADKKLTYRHTGEPADAEAANAHYGAAQFEAEIRIPERTLRMAQDLFDNLLATGGPEQKTIVFCARDTHADEVAAALNNIYAGWAAENGQRRAASYAIKCTAAAGGQMLLPDFKGAARSHFIACTVDLLTTGVDVPSLRNVVFMRYMKSPISFYQMLGRGTRIDESTGKLMFRVYDYTDATRLLGEEFKSRAPTSSKPSAPQPGGGHGNDEELCDTVLVVEGLQVRIEDAGRFILMRENGTDVRMAVEEYRTRLAEELRAEAPDAEAFRQIWIEPPRRRSLIDSLLGKGFAPKVIQHVDGLIAYDEYDVLAQTAYALTPRTRDDRAARFALDNGEWLAPMPPDSRAAILALAQQFARGGTEELETPSVLRVPAVARVGGMAALKKVGEPGQVLRQTRERLFAA
jgi:type I restriction enzyme R subunit